MAINDLKLDIIKLQDSVKSLISASILEVEPIDPEKSVIDFSERKKDYLLKTFSTALDKVKSYEPELNSLIKQDSNNQPLVVSLYDSFSKLDSKETEKLSSAINGITDTLEKIKFPSIIEPDKIVKIPKKLPEDIRAEITADIKELQKTFDAECFRSSVVLCGRVLETALHRKYYESTGKDILETQPGIGLGNLIKKLSEKNVSFDPGLTQQIHLINQVRVFSVHKKKEVFYPSRAQTHAMVLYTLDVLDKLFQ